MEPERTDEELLAAFQAGDAKAFERLLRRHRGPLFTFLLRMVGDRSRAEDLTQEAFLRVVRAAARWEARAKFQTWLYTVARNLCVDQSRRDRFRRTDSLDAQVPGKDGDGPALVEALPGDGHAPDRAADSALVLARWLGDVPSVHFALLHHTRAGHGYPRVTGAQPLRGLDVVSVASAFAAMIAPRPFRPVPYNPRGAADQLCLEAHAGHFDPRAVRLLIHCLRGAKGSMNELKLPRTATGFRPARNHHGIGQEARAGA